MSTATPGQADRRDVVWQRASTTTSYHKSRLGIPFADAQFDIAARVLRAHGVQVRAVLDLGCGDGAAVQEMANRFPLERAVLVDFSEPMLQTARDRFRDAAFDVKVRFIDLLRDAALDEVAESGGGIEVRNSSPAARSPTVALCGSVPPARAGWDVHKYRACGASERSVSSRLRPLDRRGNSQSRDRPGNHRGYRTGISATRGQGSQYPRSGGGSVQLAS